MSSLNIVILAALGYAVILFLVAFISDRAGRPGWLTSPVVYTLSISVYCTSWTFYGAVGSAARNGLEFATIYIGPTLVFLGFYGILRKLLRIRRENNITSIADFISSRYGKSDTIAALVTLIAVAGAAPYIALQLKAITTSFHVIGGAPDFAASEPLTAFWVAVGLALFTILFGTRSIDANERHYGVVAAIAVEAIVKLVALIGVGIIAVYHVADGPQDIFKRIAETMPPPQDGFGVRWIGLIFLSGAAVLCLPRQFQVTVVENVDEKHLFTAAWLFPFYLLLMSLFILPIAAVGATTLPSGSNPDMFVLTMPIAAGRDDIALLAFLGGFSSATSMVIVSCIALSTMISNHIVMPLVLRRTAFSGSGGDLRKFLLKTRRVAICGILLVGFLYLEFGPQAAGLASIGLVAFAGVAQVMPAMIGALFWPRANRRGALLGLGVGFAIWAYTLLLPGLLAEISWWQELAKNGPFGILALRPGALFGSESTDPLMHALFWSMGANVTFFILGSLSRDLVPLEQLQSALFVDVFRTNAESGQQLVGRTASADALFNLTQRIVGPNEAYRIFQSYARDDGQPTEFPEPDDAFINHLERRMAASVGAASARAMISRVAGGERISLDELVKIADETARLMEYSNRLERNSRELEETASKLKIANERLVQIDAEKDEFLSQVSHELRTPMTSIRSFSEILSEDCDLEKGKSQYFLNIINNESIRLTHLLDEILDIGSIERGQDFPITKIDPQAALIRAIDACRGIAVTSNAAIQEKFVDQPISILANYDRLTQIFINIISNALKYNDADNPKITILSEITEANYVVTVTDNGTGIAEEDRTRIFDKFARGSNTTAEKGAGLGLAISRAIVRTFGGDVHLLEINKPGTSFQITLPLETETLAD